MNITNKTIDDYKAVSRQLLPIISSKFKINLNDIHYPHYKTLTFIHTIKF